MVVTTGQAARTTDQWQPDTLCADQWQHSGWSATWSRVAPLVRAARREILALVPATALTTGPTRTVDGPAADGPVNTLAVVSGALFADQRERLNAQLGDVDEVRIGHYVPGLMIILDRKIAVLSRGRDTDKHVVRTVHSAAAVDALVTIFSQHWTDAAAARAYMLGRHCLSALQRRLLDYLAAGVTDATVARELLISTRTVQRQVTSMMTMFGAHSRLELGLRLARLGVLDAGDARTA